MLLQKEQTLNMDLNL